MSGACCLIKADLSRVAVVNGAPPQRWTASDSASGDAPTATMLASRAAMAADWFAGLPGLKKKLGAVCIDVEEVRCRWVRASGTAAPIVSAATRGLDQDWEQAVLPERVEPVLKDDAEGAGATGAGYAVLTVADALPRLFLDELDRRGVRAGEVVSLWHAMARVWDDARQGRLVCVLLSTNDGRLVWSWSRGGRLLAGGSAPLASGAGEPDAGPPEQRAARRISLDWLTWSVQLGLSPDQIIAVGVGAARAAGALGEQWEGVALQQVETDDAIGATLSRFTKAPSGGTDDPRSALVGMSRRPTRSTRTAYRWGALALIALAAAAIGVGVRTMGGAGEIRSAADTVTNEARQRITTRMPGAASQPSIDLFLQQRIAQLQQGAKFRPPPAPPPIYEEMQRILGIVQGIQSEDVVLWSMVLSSNTVCEFIVEVPDTRTGEVIKKALLDLPMAVSWSEQRAPSGGDGAQRITFRGQFK